MGDLTIQENQTAIANMANEFNDAINVDPSVIKVPRLRLIQKMSEVAGQGDIKLGDFYSSLLGKNFSNTIQIIPIMATQTSSLMFKAGKPPRAMPVGDDPKDGTVICKTSNLVKSDSGHECAKCPYNEFHSAWGKKSPPACKLSFDIIALVSKAGSDEWTREPVIFSLRKTSYKAGKELINQIARSPKKIPFSQSYTLKSETAMNLVKQQYFIVSSMVENKPVAEDLMMAIYPTARQVIEAYRRRKVQFTEEMDDEA